MTETEDQKKDRERLVRYIAREQLVSVLNDTKWAKLRVLMLEFGYPRPRYRVRCLRETGEYWDGEWYYHLPTYKYIEWLDIDPVVREIRGHLLEDKKTDYTQKLIDLLKGNHIPFSIEGTFIRIWGYQRPGQSIEFA